MSQSVKREIPFHILFWLIHFGSRWIIILTSIDSITAKVIILETSIMLFRIGLTYFSIYYLLDKLLLKKKFSRFFLFFLISFVVSILIRRILIFYVAYPFNLVATPEDLKFFDWLDIGRSIVYVYSVVILASVIYLIHRWYKEQHDKFNLMKEKLESELKYLKAQVHPHFLFNTLNNIYASSLNKKDQTSDLLLKLSGLLRYMIYDATALEVPIQKEIEMIENYIELEKVRYGDRLKVIFNRSGDYQYLKIPPLLFLPFVENSFKHGATKSIGKNWITIDLEMNDNTLIFKVENSLSTDESIISKIPDYEDNDFHDKGLGLSNLEKRVQLLFKDKYRLEIFEENNSFLSVLKLDMSD